MAEQSLKEKTAKGLFWGGISNGIQQLLGLVFGIFLARILTPDDYGMVGMLMIFPLIANAIQEFGFTNALTNKQNATHEDYNAVFWFSVLTGLCIYIILFFCAPLIADFYDTPELTPLARFLFLSFFITSTGIAHNAILFKKLMVKQKAIATIFALTCSGIIGIIMAYNGMAYWGIAAQNLIYVSLVTLSYWYFSPWRPTFKFNFSPIREILSFSIGILITNIFIHINNNLFPIILGKFYNKAEVGYFSQANKWNYMGHSFICNMIGGIAQPVLTQISDDKERQTKVFRKILRFTSFISFPAMLGLALTAKELIIITVTEKWLSSVFILQLLCIWGAFLPISTLYTNLIISKGKSKVYMWNTILLGIIQLLTMLITYHYGIHIMVIIFVLINILWLFSWHYFVWKMIQLPLGSVLKDILPFALSAASVIVITYFITQSITNIYLLFGLKILIATSLYLLIMKLSNAVVYKECIHFIANNFTNKFSTKR